MFENYLLKRVWYYFGQKIIVGDFRSEMEGTWPTG